MAHNQLKIITAMRDMEIHYQTMFPRFFQLLPRQLKLFGMNYMVAGERADIGFNN